MVLRAMKYMRKILEVITDTQRNNNTTRRQKKNIYYPPLEVQILKSISKEKKNTRQYDLFKCRH